MKSTNQALLKLIVELPFQNSAHYTFSHYVCQRPLIYYVTKLSAFNAPEDQGGVETSELYSYYLSLFRDGKVFGYCTLPTGLYPSNPR